MPKINRIYQGRILSVQYSPEKTSKKRKMPDEQVKPIPVENCDDLLWTHHALFQDAVNYYLMALLAMATQNDNPLFAIRERLSGESEYQIWEDFRRNGERRPGLRQSVAKYLTPGNDKLTVQACFQKILDGNSSAPNLLDIAVREILHVCSGDSGIQQQGRAVLPMLCDPKYTGKFPCHKVEKGIALKAAAEFIHNDRNVNNLNHVAEYLKFEWFANPVPFNAPKKGADAKKILYDALRFYVEHNAAEIVKNQEHLSQSIDALPDEFEIPAYEGGSINKDPLKRRFYAYLLFSRVEPSLYLLSILRECLPKPKEVVSRKVVKNSDTHSPNFQQFGDDAIKLSRANRGYAFRAFTSLPVWNADPDNAFLAWKEFDIAAFKEALKTLHQIDLKTKERKSDQHTLETRLSYMLGETNTWKAEENEDEAPSRIAGDPRIERINALREEMAMEYEMAEGESLSYGIQERTIRGFRDIRKKWRQIVKASENFTEYRQKLLMEALREYQTENSERIGSAPLFERLTQRENWIVWQDQDPETDQKWNSLGYASDPMRALVETTECREKIERLKEPVRLTPADPVYSGRQYPFSDWPTGYKHQAGQLAVQVFCAVRNPENNLFEGRRCQISYSAPRMLRDRLRAPGQENLTEAHWLQPMMAAAMPDLIVPLDMNKAAVFLMPITHLDGKRIFLLNFPIGIETDVVAHHLNKRHFEKQDFIGYENKQTHLRWPAPKENKSPLWPQKHSDFQCLAADLGQRDAAAFAIIEVARGIEKSKKAREIGEAYGDTWLAELKNAGLLRLPGEDANVWCNGSYGQEFYGERGRSATDAERAEALECCQKLGQDPSIFGSDIRRLSFPELNDKLLVALRRAQSRTAKLFSWAWMAACDQPQRRAKVFKEVKEDDRLPDSVRALALSQNADLLADALTRQIEQWRPTLVEALELIANRVLPRRKLVWIWRQRCDASGCYMLCTQKRLPSDGVPRIQGQRGLSLERLEQVEELRRRCQSLNRTMMRVPTEKPKAGRITKGQEVPDPCPEILEKMDALREQRVNQTAHLILAEALGVRLTPPAQPIEDRRSRDIHGEYERIPGRRPVDLIVMEDLSRYLSSQDRPRRENSRLMKWCHRAILDKIKELCEPYGIPVLETPAAWSSRFSSRDGQPGFRAMELGPACRSQFPWRADLQRYEDVCKKLKRVDPAERERLQHLHRLFEFLDQINTHRNDQNKAPRTLLAPISGGPIFVPMNGPCIQADINAAINLALRAVASPAAHDVNPRIRTLRGPEKALRARRGNQIEKLRWEKEYPIELQGRQTDDSGNEDRTPNFFFDPFHVADFGCANIHGLPIASSKGLWSSVKNKAWTVLNRLNNDRLEKWGFGRPLPEKDIPY